MRFELWSVDEYGQGSIVKSGKDVETVLTEALTFVSGINLENALTAAEKDKNWDAYFPVVMKKDAISKDTIYAGNRRNGKHECWVKDKKGTYTLTELPKGTVVRHVLGEIPQGKGKDKTFSLWYLKDHKGNTLEGLNLPDLATKTQLFVKVLP